MKTPFAFDRHFADWQATHQRRFEARAKGDELEITVMDFIGSSIFAEGVTAKGVKDQLDAAPNAKVVRVLMDSPGGFVHDGLAIQALLKRHPARVEVEVLGEASSAASVIAMAGDSIAMHEGSTMMIHRASAGVVGTAETMRAVADALDKMTDSIVDIYVARTGRSKQEIAKLVDHETWMTASEAVAGGFATSVIPAKGTTSARATNVHALKATNMSLQSPASKKPFAALRPAERHEFKAADPVGYAAARAAWKNEIDTAVARRNASTNLAERKALTAKIEELTAHGVPSSAA